MASSDSRKLYMKTFTQHMVSSTDGEISGGGDRALLDIVEETFSESLHHLETRFTSYLTTYSHLGGTSTLQTTINRSENILNAKFKSMKNAKRSLNVDYAHRQALNSCSAEIMKDLDLSGSSLLDDLMEWDLLSVSDKDSIRGQNSRKRQNEEFYGYILGRLTYDDFYNKFLPALRKEHPHLSDSLITVLDQLEDENHESNCLSCRARRIIQLKRLAAPLLQKKLIDFTMYLDLRNHSLSNNAKWVEVKRTVSDADIIDALENKYPDFHSEFLKSELKTFGCTCPSQDAIDSCEREQDVVSEQQSVSEFGTCLTHVSEVDDFEDALDYSFDAENLAGEYKMTANPRGLCLVINNISFRSFPIRAGTHNDVIKIKETFERLQFDVRVYNDLKAEEINRMAVAYAKKDHSAYDAFACIVMSIGIGDFIQGSDGLLLKLEAVTHHFAASNCPSLAGKPKIFLLQTSRGENFMSAYQKEGVDVADGADFVIGHSTVDGFHSVRNLSTGSYFIDALTKVLRQHADAHDFLSCLTMVNQTLAERTMSVKGAKVKQVSAPVFTLTKKLYLPIDPSCV